MKQILTLAALPLVAAAAAVGLASSPATASAHRPFHAPKHAIGHETSGNWSGYSVDGTGATYVTGSWVQPTANCKAVANSWASPWVGIDGDNSSTVEQTGTDSDCVRGAVSYYAWWEMYPQKTIVIPAITVRPGDSFTASVTYSSAGFTMELTDTTTGQSYSITQTSKKAQRTSVEWIMEGPSSGNLTNFGSVGFTKTSAMIGGAQVYPWSAGANPITMVTSRGADRAVPSLDGQSGFGVAWQSY